MGRVWVDIQCAADVDNLPDNKDFREWAEIALAGVDGVVGVTIRLVDVQESTALNERYRHKSGPTNVLSFPFEPPPGVHSALLGDLVICASLVKQEAAEQGKKEQAHWAHMVVHGLLHLQGYDHQTAADARQMESLEIRLLEDLGYSDPYLT